MSFHRFVACCALVCALLTAGSATAVEKGINITYSTSGTPATYADGTPVLQGERFLLVWFDTGVTIDLATDITGDENSFCGDDWWWVSYSGADNGLCPSTVWSVNSSCVADYSKGRVQLYLLDTRISPTELATMVENDDGDFFPSVVNAVVPISGASTSWTSYGTTPITLTGSAPMATAWTVYRTIGETPIPVIVSFVCTNNVTTVEATNTVPTVQYSLIGSEDLAWTNVWTAATGHGADSATECMTISETGATKTNAFYRLEVVK